MACIHSMTGFASAQGDIALGHVTVEVRCVNSRYLDLNFKICEELRFAEPALRQAISARVKRGSFECRISLKSSLEDGASTVNPAALATLKNLQRSVLSELP
ncbi:MAG: YicC/YloC family endoribonuclease, partial [Duodenibacillus sp.]